MPHCVFHAAMVEMLSDPVFLDFVIDSLHLDYLNGVTLARADLSRTRP